MLDSFFRASAAFVFCASLAFSFTACSDVYEEASADKSSLKKIGDVWVATLEGNAAQRGEALGQLLKKQIEHVLPELTKNTMRGVSAEKHAKLVHRLMTSISPAHLNQLKATAAAAGVDETFLLAVNMSPEIFSPMLCAGLGVRKHLSTGAKMIVGRNLDWFNGEGLRKYALVVIEKGPGIASFAHVTYPGLTSVATGINEHGVFAANLVVLKEGADAVPGTPVLFLVRTVLETAQSAKEATEIIAKAKRTVPQSYLFADANEAYVVESKPSGVRVRSMQNDAIAIANTFDEDKTPTKKGRYSIMMKTAGAGEIDIDKTKDILLKASMGALTVQSIVTVPADMTLYIASEKRPAAKGPWYSIHLAPLLK